MWPTTRAISSASTSRRPSGSAVSASTRCGAGRLAEQARALGDPTRLTIAAALAGTDELCVCDLAWVSERAENLVSHHLRALRSLGLATSRRDGKMVLYALTDRGRALLAAVLGAGEVAAR